MKLDTSSRFADPDAAYVIVEARCGLTAPSRSSSPR